MLFLAFIAAAAYIAEGAASVCELPRPADTCSNHVLLQHSNSVLRGVSHSVPGQLLEEEAPLASFTANTGLHSFASTQQALQIFADAVDPSCTPGLGCNLKDSISPNRSVLCVRSSERHECWDVCNTLHSPEDYQTGNILMDLEIQKSVKDARAGAFESIKCPSNVVVTQTEENKAADVIATPATEAVADRAAAEREASAAAAVAQAAVDKAAAGEAAQGDAASPSSSGVGVSKSTLSVAGAGAEKSRVTGSATDKSVAADSAGMAYTSISDADAEVVATTAEFDEAGYKEVAALGKHDAMVAYIRRVVKNLGCRITDEAGLEGVVPFYSGEHSTQSFASLEAELVHGCLTGTGSWLESMPSAYETKQRQIPGVSLGLTASFDEDGYRSVAVLKDEKQMEMYARRVITDLLGGYVKEEGDLEGMVPYFAGTKSTQSFTALVREIMSEMFRPGGWAVHPETKILKKKKVVVEGAVLAKESAASAEVVQGTSLEGPAAPAVASFGDCPFNATQAKENVPLDEQGYSALLELSNNCAMKQFMHRVVESVGCKVTDEAGMRGLVPFYSGTKGSASYEELAQDLTEKCENDAELWLVPMSAAPAAPVAPAAPAAPGNASRRAAVAPATPAAPTTDVLAKASAGVSAVLTQTSSTLHRSLAETAAPAARPASRNEEASDSVPLLERLLR